jgi:hypothetical protein
MVDNLVAEMAAQRHAEPDDLHPATCLASRPTTPASAEMSA